MYTKRAALARADLGIVLSAALGCMMSTSAWAASQIPVQVVRSSGLRSAGAQPDASRAREASSEELAAERYVDRLKALLEGQVVPHLRQGIIKVATSRPPSLTVTVIGDPSPYHVGAQVSPDGSLTVQLTTGYATLHDAALDAVAISAVLRRPRDLRRYAIYQLQVAHQNERRHARRERAQRALPFAEFIGLERRDAIAIFAQPKWRTLRDGIEAESLGWTIAQLLVRADSRLSGIETVESVSPGLGGARLSAAAGWFPVPPFATALGFAEIERSAAVPFDVRALLCRAADFMEAGVLNAQVDVTAHAGDSHSRVARSIPRSPSCDAMAGAPRRSLLLHPRKDRLKGDPP